MLPIIVISWKCLTKFLIEGGRKEQINTYIKFFILHLIKVGGQIFSKGLDGADFKMFHELCEAFVCLTVSCYDKLSVLILGDDKMAAPVVSPLEEKAQLVR